MQGFLFDQSQKKKKAKVLIKTPRKSNIGVNWW